MASHTVFIDTSLDTHLVMIVTDQDTVADFKQKVLIEHPRCFPSIGEITIHSLKVMRKGCFYHLSNSMLFKSAFDGIKSNWFVHMDVASIQVESTQKTLCLDVGANKQPECLHLTNDPSAEVGKSDDHLSKEILSLDYSSLPQIGSTDLVNKLVPLLGPENVDGGIVNGKSLEGKFLTAKDHKASYLDDSPLPQKQDLVSMKLDSSLPQKQDLVCEASDVLETTTKCKKKKSKRRTKDIQCDDVLVSDPQLEPIAKKPCLSEIMPEDLLCNSAKAPLKEHDSGICMRGADMTNPENMLQDNSLPRKSISSAKLDGMSNKLLVDDHSPSCSLVSGETKRERKLSIHRENGDSASNSSPKTLKPEVSRGKSRKYHEGLSKESDATIPLRKDPTVDLEKNIHITPVKGTAEESSIPSSSISHPQDVDMGGVGGGRLEGSIDASDKTLTDRGRKEKNGTEVLQAPRKKKSKKTKASNSKSNVSVSGVKHVNVEGHGDAKHDVFKSDKAFGQDNTGMQTKKGDDVSFQSDGMKASDLNTVKAPVMGFDNKEDQGNEPAGDSLQLTQVEWVQETQDIDEEETSIKDVDAPTNFYSNHAAAEIQDACDQRKKKSNKTKASNVKSKVSISGVEHVEGVEDASQIVSECDRAFVQDNSVILTKKVDNVVAQSERRKASKQKTKSPPVVGYDNKDYQGNGNEEDPLQLAHVSDVRETTDNIINKRKAGLIKAPASSSNTTLDLGMKERVVISTDPSLSINENKEEKKATSKKKRKSKANIDSYLPKILPEAENGSGLRIDPLEQHQLSGIVGSPQLKSNPINVIVAGQNPVNGVTDGANDYLPVPKSDGDNVNFRDYFVHENGNHEAVVPRNEPVENEGQIRKHEKELQVNKKAKKRHVHSVDTASDFEKSHGLIDNQGCRTTPRGTSEIAPITAGDRVEKSSNDHDKVETLHKFSRNKRVVPSEGANSLSANSFHSPSGVSTHTAPKVNSVAVEKPSRKETEPVLNNLKSLVTTSTKVSGESSTESSEDKDNSDASTRSPSDTSSSSDQSDGESEVNLKSPRNGYGNKVTKNSGHSTFKTKFTARKDMGLDTILRSSRSYKKAKLTASQSQPEDFESQPIPFNLDS